MPQLPVDPSAVRAWAREQGMQVGDRGRLPAAVLEGYLAAHPARPARARRAPAPVLPVQVERDVVPDTVPEPVPVVAASADDTASALRAEVNRLRASQDDLLRRVIALENTRRRMFRRA